MSTFTKRSIRRILPLVVAGLALAAGSRADDFHYVNILVGDRAADLGGAYGAVSDNASGCFYNPAGIVYGVGSNLSASVNAFSNATKSYRGALTSTAGRKLDWEQTSSVLLPNFFGATYDLSFGTLGLSYAVPDSVQRKQQQAFYDIRSSAPGAEIGEYHININDNDNSYLFGPSFAFKLGDSLSLGATLYGLYRDATVIRNQFLRLRDIDGGDAFDYSNNFEWRNGYVYRTEWGVRPILGLVWSPAEKWALGLSAARTWIVAASHEQQTTVNTNVFGSDPNQPAFQYAKDHIERETPYEARLGVAYFPTASLLFSADVSYFSGGGDYVRDERTFRFLDPTTTSGYYLSDESEEIFNFALGTEYYFSESYALRGGLYTDFANTPKLAANTANQPEHIDIFGGVLSLSRFTRSTSTTLGLGYATGSGEAQVVGGSRRIQDVDVSNLTVFLSAAYSF